MKHPFPGTLNNYNYILEKHERVSFKKYNMVLAPKKKKRRRMTALSEGSQLIYSFPVVLYQFNHVTVPYSQTSFSIENQNGDVRTLQSDRKIEVHV